MQTAKILAEVGFEKTMDGAWAFPKPAPWSGDGAHFKHHLRQLTVLLPQCGGQRKYLSMTDGVCF